MRKLVLILILIFTNLILFSQISKQIIDTTKNKAYHINYTKSTVVIEFDNTLYLNSLDTQIKCLVFFPNKKYKKVKLTCKLLKEIKDEKLKKYSIKPDKIFKYSDLYIIDDKPNLVVADSLEKVPNIQNFKNDSFLVAAKINFIRENEYSYDQIDTFQNYEYRKTGFKKDSLDIFERKNIDSKSWNLNKLSIQQIDSLFQKNLQRNVLNQDSLNIYYCKMKILFSYELDYFDYDSHPVYRSVSNNELVKRVYDFFSKNENNKIAILNCINKNENDILSLNELSYIYNLYKKLSASYNFYFNNNFDYYEYKITSYAKDEKLNINPIYFNHLIESEKTNKWTEYFYTIYGKIYTNGKIIETKKENRKIPNYPICLSVNSIILTPSGYVNILNLKINDDVISLNKYGKKEIANIIKKDSTKINFEHHVVQLILENGNKIEVSPNHPLKDGRKMSEIKAGNYINDIKVISANLVKYEYPFTYDILLSNSTSLYNVNGIWLKSTLKK